MTRRTPSAEHAKPERGHGRKSVGSVQTGSVRPVVHETHGEKSISVDGKRFLFSPDEEKKRREKEPKREEK